MKKMILLLIFVILFLTGFSFSASADTAADFLVQVGRLSYEKGDMTDAIHECNKALMLDPNHQGAIKLLNQMQQQPKVFAQQPDASAKINELSREVELYKKMLGQVESQRNDISEQLKQLTMAHENILKDNRAKEEQLKQVQTRVEEMGVNLTALQKTQSSQVTEVVSAVREPSMSVPLMVVHNVNSSTDSSLDVLERTQLNKKIAETMDLALRQDDQALALNRENIDLKRNVETQNAAQQNMLELMDDYLYIHQAKLNDLANQAVIAQVDLSEQHRALVDKTDALDQSNILLETIANKVNERDAMIQQKNLQIDDLQKRLQWYQKNFEVPVNQKS